MEFSKLKKGFVRLVRRAVLLCLLYAAGFLTAVYWTVSPSYDVTHPAAASEMSPYPSAAVSISRTAHKSLGLVGAAVDKTSGFITRRPYAKVESEQ